MDDKLTDAQLAELRNKLALMSVTAVKDAYQSAYFQCKLDGEKIPSARAIQTLVQTWKDMCVQFFARDRQRDRDKLTTILDCLRDAGVIVNDNIAQANGTLVPAPCGD